MSSQTRYFMGIEVGTAGIKVVLVNEKGHPDHSSWMEFPTLTPKPLWVEQHPQDWWKATILAIQKLFMDGNVQPSQIECIGLTGQMHGLVLLNGSGETIRPCILWNDQRSKEICSRIRSEIGNAHIKELTGNRLFPGSTMPKLKWVQENEFNHFAQVYRFVLPKDYLRYRLSGEIFTDVTDASGTGLFDVKNRKWSKEILKRLSISPNILPDVFESTILASKVNHAASLVTGLIEGTPIIAGCGSQEALAVSSGIFSEGDVAVNIGTSGVVFTVTDDFKPLPDEALQNFCYITKNKWHYMGVTLSAGGAFRWYREQFGEIEEIASSRLQQTTYDLLTECASSAPPGAEGLLFLPYLTGERSPYDDPMAKGVFFGFGLRHKRSHFIRSVMEGITFALKDSLELMKKAQIPIHEIRVSGGAMKSSLWRQMLADIFDHEIQIVRETDGAAYGAALMAGLSTKAFTKDHPVFDSMSIVQSSILPGENSETYKNEYQRFRSLYSSLQDEFKKIE
ncbi:MAG TPA: xylulokinase [Caldisericia bacterium]|nr:xylulokinase [Caldisericia bacterium]